MPLSPVRANPVLLLALAFASLPSAFAAQPEPPPNNAGRSEVAIRLSAQVLEEIANRPVNVETAVDTTYEGSPVTGHQVLAAHAGISLASQRTSDPIEIGLVGTSTSTTNSVHGPAVIRNRSVTSFKASFLIEFDGQQFLQLPGEVTAHTCSQVLGVGACRRGLIGGVIRRVAWRKANQARPNTNRFASQSVSTEVRKQGEKLVGELLAELNEAMRMEKIVQTFFSRPNELQTKVTKTRSYVQASIAYRLDERSGPPVDRMVTNSPVEVWVLAPEDQDSIETAVVVVRETQLLLGKLLPGRRGDEQPTAKSEITQIKHGDWVVINFGGELTQKPTESQRR
jgi:hypothetical protein